MEKRNNKILSVNSFLPPPPPAAKTLPAAANTVVAQVQQNTSDQIATHSNAEDPSPSVGRTDNTNESPQTATSNSIQKDTNADTEPNLLPPPPPPRRKRKGRLGGFCFRMFMRMKSTFHRIRKKSKPTWGLDNNDHDWVRIIALIFEDADGNEIMRYGKAKFDTGNPKNLVSPDFAARFGLVFEPGQERIILELPGGTEYTSMAKLRGRWSCKVHNSRDLRFQFDPKFMDADFEVSTSTEERFDVVIGANTIAKERLLQWGPGIGLTGFRTKAAVFSSK